jgi:hypothetical protein
MAHSTLWTLSIVTIFVASLLFGFFALYMFLWAFVFGDNLDPEPIACAMAIPFSAAITSVFWRYTIRNKVGSRFLWISLAISLTAVAFVIGWIWL